MGKIYSVGMAKNSFDVVTGGLLFILRNQKTLVIRRII